MRRSTRSARSAWDRRGGDPFTVSATLWLVDRLRGAIRLLGIDFPLFRLVLEQRLRLETPAYALRASKRGSKTPVGLGAAATVLWLLFSGFIPGAIALIMRDPLVWMLTGQALWIFTLALLTVTHFANVFIDPTDVAVLVSRPVDDRTLFATRVAHVLAPVLVYAGCAALLPTLFGVFRFPPLAVLIAYPLATLSSGLFVVGGVTLAMAVALRVAGPGRFQRVVFWGQVGGASLIMILSQLAPRFLFGHDILGFLERERWLGFLVPPLSEYGLYRVLAGTGDRLDLVFAALVVVLPIAIGALTLQAASRSFVAAIADPGTLLAARARGFEQSFFARLGPRVCSTRAACAAYGLALALSRRDRLFLRSVLPMLGMVTVMAIAMMVPRGDRDFDAGMASMGIYYVLMLGATTLEMSRLSEHAEAREWRRVLPVADQAALLEGSAKALLCGTIWPLLLGVGAVFVALVGLPALGEVALAVPLTGAAVTFTARPFLRALPFTESAKSSTSLDRLPRFIVLVLAMGLLIGLHGVARMHPGSILIGGLGACVLLRFGWRRLTRWDPRQLRT